jgi:hypothetical protein
MIESRNDLLTAIRQADLTPQGITVGPVSFVGGKAIQFGKVTSEETRRALLQKMKLAASRYFAPGSTWELPCSAPIKSSSQSIPKATRRKKR